MSLIGKSPPRPDGFPKVSGGAVYGDDFTLPGMLFGATVRSAHPHARIEALRWRSEKAPAGAVFLTAGDLPGPNGVRLIDDSWPVLAAEVVRHVAEPVALVAAPTRLDALRAAAAVEVDYTPLAPVLSLEEAEASTPLSAIDLKVGDIESAFADPDLTIVEGVYDTGHQEHIYIECQAMTAWWDDEGTVHAVGSMQCPYYVHKSMAHVFGLPDEKVRVRASAVGGGFGGKEDFPSVIALHAALLARASGRPVRLAYDRHEDIVGTTKRHPARMRYRTAVAGDGELRAMDVDLAMDGGAYLTLSKVVLSRAVLHASGPYRCPAVRIRGRVLRTNTAPNGAFRGFGSPQVQFAAERHLDRIARRLGIDPLEIRLRNVLEPGDHLPTGQKLDASTSGRLCLETAAEKTDFQRRWHEMEKARQERGDGEALAGLGISLFFHGAGFTGNGERRMQSSVKVRLDAEGRIEVLTAQTDMGQGCAIAFPQIAAEASGLAPEDIVFAEPDTGEVPNSGPTVASRTTMVVGETLARAVREMRELVESWWRQAFPEDPPPSFRELARRCYQHSGAMELSIRHRPPDWQEFDEETYRGSAYPTYAWGADVAEIEVDPDTLAVKPLKVTAVCEVGRVIHQRLCAGQIEGGTLQSVGWALVEEVKTDGGRYLNDRLATYIIPTAMDAPEIEVHLLENPWEGGPFGAKGVGELPMDGGAPAVLQAIENATGLAAREIPATPERLFTLSLDSDPNRPAE